MLTIGVDVSKAKLDAVIMENAKPGNMIHMVVANTPKGISSVLFRISDLGIEKEQVLFCFEQTGVYSAPLCLFLEGQGIDFWMVPAIEIKKSKGISRGKNDKTDAKDIATYAITQIRKLKLTTVPEAVITELRSLLSEREKIVKAIALFKSTKEAKGFLPNAVITSTLKINNKTLMMLGKRLKEIDTAMRDLVRDHPLCNRQYELIVSVPGVGAQTGFYLIAFTRCFTAFSSWRRLACFSGIAPFPYESGTIKRRTKVSPMGNRKLKALLTMAALSAKTWDKEIKGYYERKRKEGKHPLSIINAIKCKIIARVFAVINRDSPFVNTQKFAV